MFEIEDHVFGAVVKIFNRTEDTLKEDVETIKEWMKTQPHLPEIMDDKTIQNFLLLTKCSIEKAKLKIDMYYTVRTILSDIFDQINPKLPNLKKVMEIAYVVPLPKLTREMSRVFVIKLRNKNLLNDLDVYDFTRYTLNIQELRLKEDVMSEDIYIIDNDGITLNYLLKWTPMVLYRVLILIYEKVYSSRIKAVYFVNFFPFMEKILGIVKSFMKTKLHDRFHMCKDTSILKEKFLEEILPQDYGGKEKSLEELQELSKEKFLAYQTLFDKLDTLRVNEELRPAKLENDEFLGVHGNFRKLNID